MSDLPAEVRAQYEALKSGVGLVDCLDRTLIEVTGKDRATFLHGFCTNDIKRLEPGQGCEAFLTNVQGKTIGFVNIFCEENRLVIESAPGQGAHIISSLDRYLIREDVQLIDRGESWRAPLLAGPGAAALIKQLFATEISLEPWNHVQCPWQGHDLTVRRVDYTGATDFQIGMEVSAYQSFRAAIAAADAIECDPSAVEIARIETGSPVFGRDITDDNLPQEVDRNTTAISFTKGCYLGQETVARIDALGHVNRVLRGLQVASNQPPAPGAEFTRDGKVVARVTSACWSIVLGAPLALAYVRREFSTPGSQLESTDTQAEVVALPLV